MKKIGIPTCKDVFEHRYEMSQLGFSKRFMLKIHMVICKNCQRFESTMHTLENKMQQALKLRASKAKSEDIEKLKEEVKSKLR